MADAGGSSSLTVDQHEHELEHDVPEVELDHEIELEEGDEAAELGTAGSTACEGLPGVAGDTPSGGQPVIAKLLISNAAAGSVIGKASQQTAGGLFCYPRQLPVLVVIDPFTMFCRVVRPLSRSKRTLVPVCSCPGPGSSTQVCCCQDRWQLHVSLTAFRDSATSNRFDCWTVAAYIL
jgi:hypothetical protein